MRARLLEATVDCLVERGFSHTSTTLVSEHAGVSRGAQLHHFPTKNDLVVAAVEHLTELRGAELADAVSRLPQGDGRTRAVVRMLGDHFSSPVFTAALELWGPLLEGSVVAIGNAPTALFHLLEMIERGAPRPAAVLGLPVGFIGAAESKAALAGNSSGLPYLVVHGRRGGSAMAVAAVNAIADERE